MNKDLISREALIEAITSETKNEFEFICLSRLFEIIDNAPTVCGNNPKWCESCVSKGKCASTRPQGKWKETGYETGALGITYRQTQCSNCGWEHALPMWLNFCPNCGAKMQK